VFGHTLRRLAFADKGIGPGGERGLVTGILTSAAGQVFRSSSRAVLGALGSKSQSTNNMSVRLTGA